MKVKNVGPYKKSEVFPQVGLVELEPGEVKDLPQDIADAWMNPLRAEVIVEAYTEEEVEEAAVEPEVMEDAVDVLGVTDSDTIGYAARPRAPKRNRA